MTWHTYGSTRIPELLFFSSKRRIITQNGGLEPAAGFHSQETLEFPFTRNARRRKERRDWRNLLHHPHKPSYGDFVDASSMISHANPLHELAGWTTRRTKTRLSPRTNSAEATNVIHICPLVKDFIRRPCDETIRARIRFVPRPLHC